jgi:hypothetical protein
MKELSDEEFDALLRLKSDSFDHDFDESAWGKMEQKLRRRDRIIFVRRTGLALVLLLAIGTTGYFYNNTLREDQTNLASSKKATENRLPQARRVANGGSESVVVENPKKSQSSPGELNSPRAKQSLAIRKRFLHHSSDPLAGAATVLYPDTLLPLSFSALEPATPEQHEFLVSQPSGADSNGRNTPLKAVKSKRIILSITALMGPDFSSISSLGGNKANLNGGILLNANLSTRIALSTGVRYGSKDYSANAYNYQTPGSRAKYISGIDASCNILEVPLQLAYSLSKPGRRQLWVASGLSSYLMLKERYDFHYTPQSGYKSYQLVKSNVNQHYLGVLSLSASYRIQPKSSAIQWAIEPYVRLPLGGVGEGNVRLKSSGVSLNLTYDISKKTN